jgi:hypothetical protein
MSQMLMPFMSPGFIGPIPRGVAPGMEIMPYTGPGSEIVPKPTTIPPPRSPGIPQGPGRGRPPRIRLPVGPQHYGPQPLIGPPKPPIPRGPPKPPGLSGGGGGGAGAAAQAAPALARFIGPAFLALMGVDMLSRAGQSRRQKEMMLQQMGMMGLTGGAQYGDQLGALAMGQNYSNVIGGMGALAEGAQIPSASELELALLLGKSGAMAAQKAAVAPQMDELALDYVLGMT